MRVLDLFAGIGGFSLAAHWMGWETVAFVEREPFCQKVLAKNFPGVPIYDDVRTYNGDEHSADIVCGGFPCQDVSTAGAGVGIEGERSSLYRELLRIVRVLRPQFVVMENVAVLLGRGLGRVLGDLSEIGYDAEWRVFSACELGFPHSRERVFLVAYPCGKPRSFRILDRYCREVAGRDQASGEWGKDWLKPEMATRTDSILSAWQKQYAASPLARSDDGVSDLVDRVRGLGNTIMPQIAFGIFKAIEESHSLTQDTQATTQQAV